jgi:hypothetical protein
LTTCHQSGSPTPFTHNSQLNPVSIRQ